MQYIVYNAYRIEYMMAIVVVIEEIVVALVVVVVVSLLPTGEITPMFMYILSVEGYGENGPTRPCSHDFMAKPSLYTLPQDTIHDVGGCYRHSCSKPLLLLHMLGIYM